MAKDTTASAPGTAAPPGTTTLTAPGLQAGAEGAGQGLLEEVLPEITELARKVGGFRRLAEIAAQLDRAGAGQ